MLNCPYYFRSNRTNIASQIIKLNDIAYNRYLKKIVIGSLSITLGGAFLKFALLQTSKRRKNI